MAHQDVELHPVPDESPPEQQRQEDLLSALKANEIAHDPPCANVVVSTRGELEWLMKKRGWSGELDATDQPRADLRQIVLNGVVLGNINLNGADLTGAHLSGADLRGANLFKVDLSDSDLRRANLSSAFLPHAELKGADLERTDLRGARLLEVNLSGSYLEQTDLRGADLWSSRMDVETMLREVIVDQHMRLGDVSWNGVSLTQVDWSQAKKLGDEGIVEDMRARLRLARGRRARAQARMRLASACRETQRAYRTLAITMRSQGLVDAATTYRLCEQRLGREALHAEHKRGQLLFSRILNLVSGYGERPQNAVVAYLIVIGTFTGIYWIITHTLETTLHALSWDESLVLSLTSFHGRGFFPGTLPLGDWVARAGAVEAIIGLFIELVFIATFSRRFLGN